MAGVADGVGVTCCGWLCLSQLSISLSPSSKHESENGIAETETCRDTIDTGTGAAHDGDVRTVIVTYPAGNTGRAHNVAPGYQG